VPRNEEAFKQERDEDGQKEGREEQKQREGQENVQRALLPTHRHEPIEAAPDFIVSLEFLGRHGAALS
jgi:hypothetical protein